MSGPDTDHSSATDGTRGGTRRPDQEATPIAGDTIARPRLAADLASVSVESSASEKIGLFRRLFSGRTDVFPLRWENRNTGKAGYSPACANEWVRGVCGKPQVKCGDCRNQAFFTVSDQVIANHLRGVDRDGSASADYVAGVYPILPDGSCHFVAADFDGAPWAADALAYWETCRRRAVPAALERSRSGEGGHVWIFFSQAIPARDARHLAAVLITETLERRPELGFTSYDRLFPSQDAVPNGGFGNLIALPLQRRARDYGNSVFVDEELHAYRDQRAFLAKLGRLSPEKIYPLVGDAAVRDRVLAVRMPIAEESGDDPWNRTVSRNQSSSRSGPQDGARVAEATLHLRETMKLMKRSPMLKDVFFPVI